MTAGENPVVEVGPNTTAKEAAENGDAPDAWRFDLGLRMAAVRAHSEARQKRGGLHHPKAIWGPIPFSNMR